MRKELSGYDVGALMYCPANAHTTIADSLANERIPKPFSLAFCLEDTVHESAVIEAENRLYQTLGEIMKVSTEKAFYMPNIFIRIRNPEHLRSLAAVFKPFERILTGFILPKFFVENCHEYVQVIQEIEKTTSYYYMPIFESSEMIDPGTRHKNLALVKEALEPISHMILNIRVGGNDLSHAFGLRRPVTRSIYDLRPVSHILIDIVSTFATQYVVSGPVWEYYSGDGWDTGLRKELELDILNGFTGKTVIHPKQIPIVNEMLKVSYSDYQDACSILKWDNSKGQMVSASADSGRMNEYNTHFNWANKIVLRAKKYGVKAD